MILYERWERGFDWHTGQEGKARGFDWDTESVFMAFRDTALTEVNVSAKSPLYFNWLFEHLAHIK